MIGAALAGGAESKAIIHVGDFGAAGLRTIPSGQMLTEPRAEALLLAVGIIDALPAGHWLRDAIPAAELYLHAGQSPAIVLGPVNANGTPRAWYPVALAKMFTTQFHIKQLRDEEERAYQERTERAREAREFHDSEIGRLRQRLKLLEQMERAGMLPAGIDVPPEPAVRIGRG